VLEDSPGDDHQGVTGDANELVEIVGDPDGGDPFCGELRYELFDVGGAVRVEGARALIEEEHVRAGGERSGQAKPLEFTAREVAG
jgi:hypothetical protein